MSDRKISSNLPSPLLTSNIESVSRGRPSEGLQKGSLSNQTGKTVETKLRTVFPENNDGQIKMALKPQNIQNPGLLSRVFFKKQTKEMSKKVKELAKKDSKKYGAVSSLFEEIETNNSLFDDYFNSNLGA